MKRDYRHLICAGITLGFVLLGVFVFFNSFGRLFESLRDLGLSLAYYVCELFGIPYSFSPTVNELPKYLPPVFLPETWVGFQASWNAYWTLWTSQENFLGYFVQLGNFSRGFVLALLPVFCGILLLRMGVEGYLKEVNHAYGEESRPLRLFKRVMDRTFRPVRAWCIGFFAFLREHRVYPFVWAVLWTAYFNLFTIVIEFFAWYFFFVLSFDVAGLYLQVYKLAMDLSVPLGFFPWWMWLIGAVVLLDRLAVKRAYDRLSHNERRNRGFCNERGVVTIVFGPPGVGKTTFITDMALSYEVQMLDDALEIILDTDMHFPYFPWINLENELKRAIAFHVCYDVWSVRRWLGIKRTRFCKTPARERIFGYDYERYGMTYDNALYPVELWDALEDYALAYFIYTVQSSYIVSNYSIRSDKLIHDLGNFPLWDTDFFRRDSRIIDSYSRHAHILDYDMLRLGKRMLEKNPNRNAFGFGIYVVSEIDKERKNAPELKEVKASGSECNQKNDLFSSCIKMSRHACVVANRVFVHVLADLQRTGDLSVGVLELGETAELRGKSDMIPVLPFWSPYWIAELLVGFVLGRHDPFYLQYRNVRGDNTLFMYLFHGLAAVLHRYRERMCDLFGCERVSVRVERGTKDGDGKDCVWFRQSKKIYAKRFKTDCMSAIFEAHGQRNEVGLDELRTYADIMASQDERKAQHSHFQSDIDAASSD